MALTLRQYQKIYNKHLLKILKDGRIPSFEEVISSAGQDLPQPNQPATPIYKYRPQAANSVVDIQYYNKAISNILVDLDTLFEELTEIEVQNIQRILHAELFNAVHSFELNRLNKQLDALLFSLQGADDNFFTTFDSFSDLSKTDLAQSTQSVVALDEGCLALPISTKGTLKIRLDHLYEVTAPNITLSRDSLSRSTIAGTKFGNIFKDALASWGYVVDTDTDGPLSIQFAFALSLEEFVNRITLIPHSEKPQIAFVETSVDNVNIKPLINYSSGVTLESQSSLVSLDFEDTLVEFVYVTLSKDQADLVVTEGNKDIFRYTFGLKNISIYTTGRSTTATYYSKPFDFGDDLTSIGKIGITADETIPEGTSIDWAVGLYDQDNELAGSYVPILPQSRVSVGGLPKTVLLQDTVNNIKYITNTANSYVNVFDFYSISFWNMIDLETEPIFGTAQLFRGYRSWFRDTIGTYDTISVKDNFIPFSKAPLQFLYAVHQEVLTIKTIANVSNQRIVLTTKQPLYLSDGSYSLTPLKTTNVDKDTAPSYAIYKVSLASGPVARTKTGATFTSSQEDLGQPNIIYNTKEDIVIQEKVITATGNLSVGAVVRQFVDGVDYLVELTSDGYTTGKILLTSGSPLASGTSLGANSQFVISYTTDDDITRFVSSIKNNQVIFTITASNSVLTNEQVIIRYRFIPDSILKSSIKVKGFFGSAGNQKIYSQGVDYIFDSANSTIQKLSTGGIPDKDDVYIDFKYNENISSIQQFFIWAFISDITGEQIKVQTQGPGQLDTKNTLIPDLVAGESFSANIPGLGLVDLTSATVWPKMVGWIQFIVKSRSPETLQNTSQVPLIKQIIQIKDINGDHVFVQNGKFFGELTAIRDPLKQVSLPFLKTNVLKNDRTAFAIREQIQGTETVYQVIINFEPNTTNELYSFSVDPDTGGIVENNEEWKLTWVSKEVSDAFTKVVVRAILNRNTTTDGNITPKVFGYNLKVTY